MSDDGSNPNGHQLSKFAVQAKCRGGQESQDISCDVSHSEGHDYIVVPENPHAKIIMAPVGKESDNLSTNYSNTMHTFNFTPLDSDRSHLPPNLAHVQLHNMAPCNDSGTQRTPNFLSRVSKIASGDSRNHKGGAKCRTYKLIASKKMKKVSRFHHRVDWIFLTVTYIFFRLTLQRKLKFLTKS